MIIYVCSNNGLYHYATKEVPCPIQLQMKLGVSKSIRFNKFLKNLKLLQGTTVCISATMEDGDKLTVIKTELVD